MSLYRQSEEERLGERAGGRSGWARRDSSSSKEEGFLVEEGREGASGVCVGFGGTQGLYCTVVAEPSTERWDGELERETSSE